MRPTSTRSRSAARVMGAVAAAVLALSAAACGDDVTDDEVVEDVEQGVESVGDDIEEGAESVGDEIEGEVEEEAEDAGDGE